MNNTYNPNTMQTISGKYINPTNPNKDDLKIYDLAHALSLSCRCGGHSKFFYSVAHHSVNVWYLVKLKGGTVRQQLIAACHDLSEGILSDLPSPLKRQLPEYQAIEKKVQDTIYEIVGLGEVTDEEYALVKECDLEMLYNEAKVLMNDVSWIPNAETFNFSHTWLIEKNLDTEGMRDMLLDIIDNLMKKLDTEDAQ